MGVEGENMSQLVKRNTLFDDIFPDINHVFEPFAPFDLLRTGWQSLPIPQDDYRIEETDMGLRLELAIPGYKKSDLDVYIENDRLNVQATIEKNDKKGSFRKSFKRSWLLKADVNLDSIEATYEDGVLVVTASYDKPKVKGRKVEIR
jgi:HSP20 family protein